MATDHMNYYVSISWFSHNHMQIGSEQARETEKGRAHERKGKDTAVHHISRSYWQDTKNIHVYVQETSFCPQDVSEGGLGRTGSEEIGDEETVSCTSVSKSALRRHLTIFIF